MKVICGRHGAHFKTEFRQTLQKGCGFWRNMNLHRLNVRQKRGIWDWIFTMPADQIFLETGIQIHFGIRGRKLRGSALKDAIPGYEQMSEAKRKALQKGLARGIFRARPKSNG